MSRRAPARLAPWLGLALLASACGLRLTPPKPLESKPVLLPEEAWTRVLEKRLDAQGRFDYQGLREEPAELQGFLSYVATFSPESDPDRFPTAAARLAYWINAYNAVAAYAVIDSSFRPADGKKFYSRLKTLVGGSMRSLSDLEEEIAALKDARAYFAVNGAAKGHPRLAKIAYTPGGLEAELDKRVREFMNDPRNSQVDRSRKVVRLSEVFKWRRDVLTDRAASILAYINRFRDDKLPEGAKVEYIPFDWSLNSQKEERAEASARSKPAPAMP